MTSNKKGPAASEAQKKLNNFIKNITPAEIFAVFLENDPQQDWRYFDRTRNTQVEDEAILALMDLGIGYISDRVVIELASGDAANLAALAGHTLFRVETRGLELVFLAWRVQPTETHYLPKLELNLDPIDEFLDEMRGLLETSFIRECNGRYRAVIDREEMLDYRRKLTNALRGARSLACRDRTKHWKLDLDTFDWDSVCGYVRRKGAKK